MANETEVAKVLVSGSIKEPEGKLGWPAPDDPTSRAGKEARKINSRIAAIAGDAAIIYGEGDGGISDQGLIDPTAVLFTARFVILHEADRTKVVPWRALRNVTVTSGECNGSHWQGLSLRLEFDGYSVDIDSPRRGDAVLRLVSLLEFALEKLASTDVSTLRPHTIARTNEKEPRGNQPTVTREW